MAKRKDLIEDSGFRKAYQALLDASAEINGYLVVKNVRELLRPLGLDDNALNLIQGNSKLLRRIGTDRPAVYQLTRLEGFETSVTKPMEEVVEVVEEARSEVDQQVEKEELEVWWGDKQVSANIPPKILKKALEVLWTHSEQEIERIERASKELLQEAESLRAKLAIINLTLKDNSEQIDSLHKQSEEVLGLLERLH